MQQTSVQTGERTIYQERVYVNALNRLHSVSQQFDRMSGMFTDYFSNVMLAVCYVLCF